MEKQIITHHTIESNYIGVLTRVAGLEHDECRKEYDIGIEESKRASLCAIAQVLGNPIQYPITHVSLKYIRKTLGISKEHAPNIIGIYTCNWDGWEEGREPIPQAVWKWLSIEVAIQLANLNYK